MDDPTYDLVLRDPEGGILQRWLLNYLGVPCLGTGDSVAPVALWREIVAIAQADMAARKEMA